MRFVYILGSRRKWRNKIEHQQYRDMKHTRRAQRRARNAARWAALTPRQKIAVIVLAAVLVILGSIFGHSPAKAATAPRPVVSWQTNGWAGMAAQPPAFYFEQGAAPYITGMKWTSWGPASAYGTGRLHIARVLCAPTSAPGCTSYTARWVSVRLSDVKTHSGRRYFASMTVKFVSKGRELTRHLAFRVGLGTAPFWQEPAVWPYL